MLTTSADNHHTHVLSYFVCEVIAGTISTSAITCLLAVITVVCGSKALWPIVKFVFFFCIQHMSIIIV